MNENQRRKIRNNPHYRPNPEQQLELKTQQFDLELTAPIIRRKRRNSKPKAVKQEDLAPVQEQDIS